MYREHNSKLVLFFIALTASTISVGIYLWTLNYELPWNSLMVRQADSTAVHIATVICGNRLEEGTTMLKSVLIFSKSNIVFHIFIQNELRQSLNKELKSWSLGQMKRVKVKLYDPYFPAVTTCPGCGSENWSNLFAPCAAQRLYFPDLLTDVDSLLYMDTDNLFLSPVEDVWAHFTKFTPNQIAGIAVELSGWYENRTIPYCTETGVNTGVMLMNLTRMRLLQQWMVKLRQYYTTYKDQLRLGDQDLINIYCHHHPDQFYIMSCPWNYRSGFCPSDRPCNEAETQGAYILHGNNHVFHNDIFPAIREVYISVKEHNPTTHTVRDLYNRMLSNMEPFQNTSCGERPHIFTRNVEKYILTNERTSG